MLVNSGAQKRGSKNIFGVKGAMRGGAKRRLLWIPAIRVATCGAQTRLAERINPRRAKYIEV